MEQRYYLRLGKKVRGPLSAEQFRRLRNTGKLPSATEYSTDRQVWGRIPESVAEIDEDPKDAVAEIDEDPEHAVAEIDQDVVTASRASTPPPVPRDALKTRAAPRSAIADRYDVFISYCREDGATIARLFADKMTAQGFRVFLDVEELGSGNWSQELELRINECPDFVVVLTASYVSRLRSQGSVIQREVATALERGRNIVPLLVETMPSADQLPASVAALPYANGVRYVHEYTDAVMIKLCALLRSARLTGPERLRTGEAQPRAIVCCVAMALGALQGPYSGAMVGRPQWGLVNSLVYGILWTFVVFGFFLLPALILLGVGSLMGIRRDRLYLGPWLLFWALFIPVVMMAVSVVPTVVLSTLHIGSYFWGGIIGMVVGLVFSGLVASTNVWVTIRAALGPSRR